MGKRFILVVAALLVAAMIAQGSEPPRPRQIQITMTVKQGDPLGSLEEGTIKVLSEPKLVTLEKREASLLSGSEVMIDGETVQAGHHLSITAQRAPGDRLRLRLVTEHVKVLEKHKDSARVQSTKTLSFRTVNPGQVIKLRWGNDTSGPQKWVELSVQVVD